MIRLCPLPYSLSNGALSTFPTVTPWSFALATAIATPKLLIHVFIGSRLKALAGEKMDAGTKAVNWASIVLGAILGVGVGWWVYQRTRARARQLEVQQEEEDINKPGRRGSRGLANGRSAGAGEGGLEHPDAFVDDLDEEGGAGEGTRLSRRWSEVEVDDVMEFEWGDDDDDDGPEPYADEPSSRKTDEESRVGMGNGKPGH